MSRARAVHPLSGIYAATKALDVTYGTLKRKGTTRDAMDSLTHFAEFNELIGAAGGGREGGKEKG